MTTEEIRYLGDVQRLALRPGDVIVLSCPTRLSDAATKSIGRIIAFHFPDHPPLILQDGIQIGVIGVDSANEVAVVTAD